MALTMVRTGSQCDMVFDGAEKTRGVASGEAGELEITLLLRSCLRGQASSNRQQSGCLDDGDDAGGSEDARWFFQLDVLALCLQTEVLVAQQPFICIAAAVRH